MSVTDYSIGPATDRLLRRVAIRQRLASLGRRFHVLFLALAGVYAALFLASRLLALLPDAFEPLTLAIPPAAAVLLAALWHHTPARAEAAHRLDTQADANDLFLTAATLASAPGDYKPIVLEQAESRAATLHARDMVRWHWQHGARNVMLYTALLLLAIRFLPQLDPFGRHAQRQQEARQLQELADARRAIARRAAEIK
ncbi:hypothetical protein HQ576_08715, partial [bacterium]|nr:hypothetical protein [bacterium]